MACIAKRRDRYIIDFYDNQGKRRWKTLPKGTTKGKAKEALRNIEDKLAKGNYIPDKKVPTFGNVAQDWLEYKCSNIRKSTWDMYKGFLKCHFSDINDLKVNQITPAKVEKFITEKQQKEMNISTLRKILVTFNQVMNYSVRHKYIDHNPVRDAEKPRDTGKVENQKKMILNAAEIKAFLGSETNLKYHTLFRLAVFSGARQGELLGLKWTDVDWFNRQIHIQRTFNKGTWYKPKTKTSNRKIDIGPITMEALKKWQKVCPASKLDLIFPNSVGNPIDQSKLLRKYFFPALRIAGIKRIRFHDMRHTFASHLIEQGENIKYIQTQLGHASPTITLDVYAHLMNPVNNEASDRLEKSIFQTSSSKMVAKSKKLTSINDVSN